MDNKISAKTIKEQTLEWLLSVAGSQKAPRVLPPRKTKSRNPSLCLQLSDVHYGKSVKATSSRKHIFNMDVADARLASIPSEIMSFVPDDIDEIRVLLTGDIVDGEDIFPQQNAGLEAPLIYQTKRATEGIWKLLNSLRLTYDVPVIAEFVPGNHGRMSKTSHATSNWDNAVCQSLSFISAASKEKRIIINSCFDSFNLVDVKDKVIALNHYGLVHLGTPAMQKKFASWILSKDFDALVSGHWHQWGIANFANRLMISNGSVCGPDDLSEEIAREENARQGAFLVYPGEPIRHFSFVEWSV